VVPDRYDLLTVHVDLDADHTLGSLTGKLDQELVTLGSGDVQVLGSASSRPVAKII
jgi:hypothetical protein